MGSIYQPKDKHVLYMSFKNAAGKWTSKSTGIRVAGLSDAERKKRERRAQAMLDKIEARIAAGVRFAADAGGPATVRRYASQWIAERKRRGVGSAADDDQRLRHAMEHLGDLPLGEVRVRHVRDMMRALKQRIGRTRADLSPRTVLHVYRTLHTLFEEAVADELVDGNPCKLKKSELPKKVDKDPEWRSRAIFTRDEVETLISDEAMPWDRRVLVTLLAFTGMRFGEVAALRWSAYDAAVEPLGMLSVHASYDLKNKRRKGVKTDVPRRVPVHPVLARVLAEWKLRGWEQALGRSPTRDDLIVPTAAGKHRGKPRDSRPALAKFHGDLDRLGLRRRRQHDLRRTFVTLCLADGARKDVLRWVTHGPEGDIVDLYTTLPWKALCDEVAKLKIERRAGTVIALPVAAAGDAKPAISGDERGAIYYPFTTRDRNAATSRKKSAEVHGNRMRSEGVGDDRSEAVSPLEVNGTPRNPRDARIGELGSVPPRSVSIPDKGTEGVPARAVERWAPGLGSDRRHTAAPSSVARGPCARESRVSVTDSPRSIQDLLGGLRFMWTLDGEGRACAGSV